MNKTALATLVLGLSVAAPAAYAQSCPPGSWLCAEVTIGGGVAVQPIVRAVPPPPVVMQAPPPVVVVQPPQPRVIYMPPPPPRVYVTAPPPVIVYQPAMPQQVYVQQYQQQQYMIRPAQPAGYFGIQASVLGSFLGTSPTAPTPGTGFIGGAQAGFRFRSRGVLGGELTVGYVGGRDYNGDTRAEIPITVGALVYFNPQNRFQVYGTAGMGVSFADVRYNGGNTAAHGGLGGANYAYLGGYAGIGAEFQLSQRFSLFADVRGFLRGRIDDSADANPEFARITSSGSTQTTNLSGGILTQLGAVVYF